MVLMKRRQKRQSETIQQDIRKALDVIRPILRIEECALTLSSFNGESGVVVLESRGVCPDCELSVQTFLQGIETQLKLRVPEIREIQFITSGAK